MALTVLAVIAATAAAYWYIAMRVEDDTRETHGLPRRAEARRTGRRQITEDDLPVREPGLPAGWSFRDYVHDGLAQATIYLVQAARRTNTDPTA